MTSSAGTGRRVLLAGASGLVGGELLQQLLVDPAVAAVHVVARRELPLLHPKLSLQLVQFTALPPLPRVEEAFIALGTTRKQAGSQAAFRAVDFDAVLAVAQAARAAGARRLGVVSAMGADPHSRVFYSRVKGQAEQALATLAFETLVIARPSLLTGDRHALGQQARTGEAAGLALARWLGPLVPRAYRPIAAADVAGALVRSVRAGPGQRVLLSAQMQPA